MKYKRITWINANYLDRFPFMVFSTRINAFLNMFICVVAPHLSCTMQDLYLQHQRLVVACGI